MARKLTRVQALNVAIDMLNNPFSWLFRKKKRQEARKVLAKMRNVLVTQAVKVKES